MKIKSFSILRDGIYLSLIMLEQCENMFLTIMKKTSSFVLTKYFKDSSCKLK